MLRDPFWLPADSHGTGASSDSAWIPYHCKSCDADLELVESQAAIPAWPSVFRCTKCRRLYVLRAPGRLQAAAGAAARREMPHVSPQSGDVVVHRFPDSPRCVLSTHGAPLGSICGTYNEALAEAVAFARNEQVNAWTTDRSGVTLELVGEFRSQGADTRK